MSCLLKSELFRHSKNFKLVLKVPHFWSMEISLIRCFSKTTNLSLPCFWSVFAMLLPWSLLECGKTRNSWYGKKGGKQIVHVLCVGDGANDMGMIRESDVGVGIKGKEGLQAFNNADVSIPSFQAMTKLLFVHGKSNENRLQVLVLYFLYKNTLLSILTLILSYLSMFSGIKLMPSWGVDFFNT